MKRTNLVDNLQTRKSITAAGVIFVFITIFAIFTVFRPVVGMAQENSRISAESSSTDMGKALPIKIYANAVGSDRFFVLTLNSKGAGLSEEYSFDKNNIAQITDNNGKTIKLNRYIAGDGAVNYWFELDDGETSEFSLNCTSGVYVVTEHEINDYNYGTVLDENGKEITLSKSEIIDNIKSEKQAENANAKLTEMTVFFGSGNDFDSALKSSAERDKLSLEWKTPKSRKLILRSGFSGVEKYVDSGQLTDTITWKYTKNEIANTSTLIISGTGDMPNYTSSNYATSPWRQKGYTSFNKIVIEDGITRIGNHTLRNLQATAFSIGKDVTEIGSYALGYNNFTNITVPGNVKTIGEGAFYFWGPSCSTNSIVLEEGVESIGSQAFYVYSYQSPPKFTKLHFPSTIKSVKISVISTLEEISIGNNNDNGTYYIDDGVLFKRLDNSGVQLVWYPAKKDGKEYTIPTFVTNINSNYAFSYTTKLKKITIPSTVTTKITAERIFDTSAVEEIVVEKGAVIANSRTLDYATNLRKLSINDGGIVGNYPYYHGGNLLEEIYIPSTVTGILDYALSICTPNVKKVYFDAKYVSGYQAQPDKANKYELTIGKNVDKIVTAKHGNLPTGFKTILKNAIADKILFVGPNQINIINPEFEDMPTPLNTLYGTIWVDEQGVVYKYDKTTLTASVAYVPYGITSVTIPKTITPETDIICTVNEVGTYAFKLAADLKSVSFEDPSAVEIINAYGFANCSKLASVNGATTETAAAESFTNPNVKIGVRAFVNTSLASASGKTKYMDSMNGKQNISFGSNFTLWLSNGQWIANGENGGYKFLTGQNADININIQDDRSDDIYRVYFEFSELDGKLSITEGQTLTFNDSVKAVCHATEAPNIYYVDFSIYAGSTAQALLTASYASPTSSGGEMKVWCFKLSKEQAEAQEGIITECAESQTQSDSIQSYWTVQPDDFTAKKQKKGTPSINLIGDGQGNIVPEDDITWSVQFTRNSDQTLEVGKDFVNAVDFYDYVVLPEYISWNPDVVTAVKNQDISCVNKTLYAGDIKVASVGSGYSFWVEWSEEKQTLLFHWRIYNSSTSSEIAIGNFDITVYKEAISTDARLSGIPSGTNLIITNHIYSVAHYTYSDDRQSAEQEADAKLYLKPATIELNKSTTQRPTYFGDDSIFTISMKNTGSAAYVASQAGSYKISDPLSQYFYIKPENIEKMMRDEFGKKLTVTISNARLSKSKTEVTAYDNTTTYKNAANSDMSFDEDELTITWNGGSIQVTAKSDTSKTAVVTDSRSLKSIFEEWGFYDVYETKYNVEWTLNSSDEYYTINGGCVEKYIIYANFKDTFQLLKIDRPTDYSNTKYLNNIPNAAYLYDNNGAKIKESSILMSNITREAILTKSVYNHGSSQPLTDNFNVAINQVLDNHIVFNHYGNGSYDRLPMVDDISGAQTLLVSVEDNKSLSNLGLSKVTVDETEYYKLNKVGTYRNIVVGINNDDEKLTADTISVTESSQGLDTQIKWYYSHIDGKRYLIDVCYYTIVDFDILKSADYNISNKAWMNDRENDRLYTGVFGGGSLLSFNKSIVYKNQDGTYTVDDDDYSIVGSGESVIYRLTLSNTNEFDISVSGDSIVDMLPINANLFSWEKDTNVSLSWQETSGVTVTGIDDWSIERDTSADTVVGAYYIKWSSDANIKIQPNKTFNMYITLDFPSDSTIWRQYCNYMNGEMIYNTFKVYGYPDSVRHSLKGKGEVVLQKGVYNTMKYSGTSFVETSSRVYYNNRDYTKRAIMYYVTLYNNGDNRLYLTDMQDKLPDGFTYLTLRNSRTASGGYQDAITTISGTSNSFVDIKTSSLDDIKFLSVNVSCEKNDDNTLRFKFSESPQSSNTVKYDKDKKKLYLERGEAIIFSYICDIGIAEDSLDKAVNTIGMNYYDYLNAGVSTTNSDELTISGKLIDKHTDLNDGTRMVESAEDVSAKYGFSGSGQWLVSDVTVSRGGIIPGITNFTDSHTDMNGHVTKYENNAPPFDIVNWRSRMHNSGFRSINDYTFTNTFPLRYSMTGSLSLKIHDNTQSDAVRQFNDFISVVSDRTVGDTEITIKSNCGTNYTVPLDGTSVTIPVTDTSGNKVEIILSIIRNQNGQEVLTIHFADKAFSIPEDGGYVDVTLSSVNVTGQVANTVYTNSSVITPNKQDFTTTTQGSLVYDEDGKVVSVVNNSSVNITFGASTSAVKSVYELNNTENKTDSKQSVNYITLQNNHSEFRYILSVKNETNTNMDKLVIIDTLPKLNDTSPFDSTALRGSEFAVMLSETPDFAVKITYSDGSCKTLSSDEYELSFKGNTNLTSDDWKGTSTWSGSADSAEAIRLIISDKTLIPDEAVVEFSFNAKAKGTVEAGKKAWNSFGYHYILDDANKTELEAMPLDVGVQIPETPLIQKNLVDIEGNTYTVKQDTVFSFLIYKGEKLNGSYSTSDELIQALETAGTPYQRIDLTVKKGESTASQKLALEYNELKWIEGQKYTMVELPTDDLYKLGSWNYVSQNSVTFTYSPSSSVTLLCQNICKEWSIALLKSDSDNTDIKLENAKFAIYSPNPNDKISDDDYEALRVKPDKIINLNDKEWYLMDVKSTDTNGRIEFENLLCDEYCIIETEAPEGYILTAEPKIVTNNSLLQKLEVFNHKAPILPGTGNKGIADFISFGTGMILTVAVFMFYRRLKKMKNS